MDISNWIALGAFAVSCFAVVLNWKTRRDYRLNLEPVVTTEQKGPNEIALSLRSVSNIGYRIKQITVIWPPTRAIAGRDDRPEYVWRRSLSPNVAVSHAGSRGDAAKDTFMFAPRPRLIWQIALLRWKATHWITRSDGPSIKARFIVQVETERGASKFFYKNPVITFKEPGHG